MIYSIFLVKAVASEEYFWPDIDKKYAELKAPGVINTGKLDPCLMDLPPKALLRAIKLLEIDKTTEGKAFVSNLLNNVFRKEIERFNELREENNITFARFTMKEGLFLRASRLARLAAIYACLCVFIGHPVDDEAVGILEDEYNLTAKIPLSIKAGPNADDWMRRWANPKTFFDICDNEWLYDGEMLVYDEAAASEDLPLRAIEDYPINKKDVRDIFSIAEFNEVGGDFDRIVAVSLIIKLLARYANKYKDAYLELALSPDANTNKLKRSELKKLERKIDQVNKLLEEKQALLNSQQLLVDKLNKKLSEQEEELQRLREYNEALEAQLEADDEQVSVHDEQGISLDGKKVVVVGGFFGWQQKLKELYPAFVFIDSDDLNFDTNILNDADAVLFNFIHSSHSLYYRLKANYDGKITYIANNNLEQFRTKLMKALQ